MRRNQPLPFRSCRCRLAVIILLSPAPRPNSGFPPPPNFRWWILIHAARQTTPPPPSLPLLPAPYDISLHHLPPSTNCHTYKPLSTLKLLLFPSPIYKSSSIIRPPRLPFSCTNRSSTTYHSHTGTHFHILSQNEASQWQTDEAEVSVVESLLFRAHLLDFSCLAFHSCISTAPSRLYFHRLFSPLGYRTIGD